jgi:hypothetical protein
MRICVFALCIAAASFATAAEPSAKVFRAGAFAADITPLELPVIVNGGMIERTSDKVVDRLHARALVLDDGSTALAIVVVDNCMVPRELLDEAKRLAQQATGIATERMLISSTHTHSAPSVFGCLGSDADPKYSQFLPGQIAKAVALAHKNLGPAQIGWAVGKDDKNVFCRRYLMKPGTARTNPFGGTSNDRAQMNPGHLNPNAVERTGPVDTEVGVLAVRSKSGRPIAVLGNYSTHYAGAPALSADYFGVFADRIGKLVAADDHQPAFVGIMSNATSGDANCNDFNNPRRKYRHITVGEDTAQAAYAAYQTIQWRDWVPLVMEERLLTLKIRMPAAEEITEAQKAATAFADRKPKDIPEVYARETLLLAASPATRELKLQALRIGELGLTAIPNEVYGSTGLRLKAKSPLKPTFNIELANGCFGYIPPPEQHKLGGYTTWRARTSCLEVDAEPKIVVVLLELLDEVAQQRKDEEMVNAE